LHSTSVIHIHQKFNFYIVNNKLIFLSTFDFYSNPPTAILDQNANKTETKITAKNVNTKTALNPNARRCLLNTILFLFTWYCSAYFVYFLYISIYDCGDS